PLADVEVSVSSVEDGAQLEILDRGSGMTEPVLRQAMLPFFSTKASGTGVGLALSREIVEAHGGKMTLSNREGGGLIVSVFLPLARPPALSERSFPSLAAHPDLRSTPEQRSSPEQRSAQASSAQTGTRLLESQPEFRYPDADPAGRRGPSGPDRS
ncbi:MAG TPA: ATP-binding protein, partial [Polyangiaceae bacterium]|nr:ATP-binding protein [Polyangiaceae bacterium]